MLSFQIKSFKEIVFDHGIDFTGIKMVSNLLDKALKYAYFLKNNLTCDKEQFYSIVLPSGSFLCVCPKGGVPGNKW